MLPAITQQYNTIVLLVCEEHTPGDLQAILRAITGDSNQFFQATLKS